MQYCIILNKLSSMWTHRWTPGVLVISQLGNWHWFDGPSMRSGLVLHFIPDFHFLSLSAEWIGSPFHSLHLFHIFFFRLSTLIWRPFDAKWIGSPFTPKAKSRKANDFAAKSRLEFCTQPRKTKSPSNSTPKSSPEGFGSSMKVSQENEVIKMWYSQYCGLCHSIHLAPLRRCVSYVNNKSG